MVAGIELFRVCGRACRDAIWPRFVCLAILVAVGVGACFGAAIVALSPPGPRGLEALATAFFLGGAGSIPLTFPGGLIGGLWASRLWQKRGRVDTRSAWIRRSTIRGALLGAIVCAVYFGPLALEDVKPFLFLVPLGGVAGLCAGRLFGLLTARG